MWSNVLGVDGGDNHAGIGDFGGVPAVFAHHADDAGAEFFGELKSSDEIWGNVLLEAAASD